MASPQPPLNVVIVSPYIQGVLDIRWDDPALLALNSDSTILGVNVYRSDASDRGPYRRVNTYPVGGTFFRDYTQMTRVSQEVVPWEGGWQSRGDAPNLARWTLRTRLPIHKPRTEGLYANTPDDVVVLVNGVPARVVDVFGQDQVVTLASDEPMDPRSERLSPSPLPAGPEDVVTVSYYTLRNLVSPGIDKKSFYRVTTVAEDPEAPGGMVETPLNQTQPSSDMQIEQLDYIWREGIRRNRWILEQGGERVRLFVMKVNGTPCECQGEMDSRSRAYNKQPSQRCLECFGTGFLGGYEGPYDIILAPDDSEKRISQGPTGRRKEHSYEVWMTFTPIISQRDFVVKQNNDRYSVGPVRRPTNRGNVMQQHFNIQYIDSKDIRYKVPVDSLQASPNLPWPQTRYPYGPARETYDRRTDAPWPTGPDAVSPMASSVDTVGPEVQTRWRTGTGTNQNY